MQAKDSRVFSATVKLSTNSTLVVNTESLRNTEPTAVLIHEIRWDITAFGVDPGNGADLRPSGAMLGCALKINSHALTNGHIPVWNFGKYFDPFDQGERLTYGPQSDTVDGEPSGPQSTIEYRWRLKHPIFVPPGGLVSPEFENRGGQPGTIQARITYLCEVLPTSKIPDAIHLPWVTFFASKSFGYSDADTDVSGEFDLYNPHEESIRLERLTGRIAYRQDAAYGYEDFDDTASGEFGRVVGSRLLRIRMDFSAGSALIPIPTYFRNVFSYATRSWELPNGATLAPHTYLRLYFTKEVSDIDTSSPRNDQVQGFVGVVGWRELKGSAL